ncbi:MAG: cupin domain-containing protein [Thermoplasmatota archaeon]
MNEDDNPKIIKQDEMEEKLDHALNEALSLFRIEDNIQVGLLKLEPKTRLPPDGMSEHELCHEFSYVIQGEVILGTESGEKRMEEGEMMYNRPGTKHYTYNDSSKPAELLWFLSPPLEE